jgi:nucleoside-diphosphate-sugar epimerase
VSRYFVTGATGFVGAEVAKQLRTRGHQVVALVRSPEKASLLAKLGCELHVGDITAPDTLRAGMRGVDGVFHLAAWYKTGVPQARALAEAVNIAGTRHVLDVMRELGIARGVYTSSLAVCSDTHGALVDETYRYAGPHLSLYDETKWRAHYEVALPAIAGLPLVIVQPGVVYGRRHERHPRIFVHHLRRRLPFVPSRTAYCWGHVDDTAHAQYRSDGARPRGRDLHHRRTGTFAARRGARGGAGRGRPAPIAGIPPALLRGLARVMDGVEALLPLPASLKGETLRVVAGVTYLGSSAKAAREFGFAPRPLDEGMRHLIEHEMRVLGIAPR